MAVSRTDPASGPEFALENLAVEDGRVVVSGRWYGVVGRRFVRPALSMDGQRRVIADLEHKPWAAEEGAPWVAAFPHTGGAFDTAALEVAPDVTVDLATGRTARKQSAARKRAPAVAAKAAQAKAANTMAKVEREREDLRTRLDHLTRLREEAVKERDEAVQQRDAALAATAERERRARDDVRAELDAARTEQDATYVRATRAEQELEAVRAELTHRSAAAAEVDQLRGERDAARAEAERLRGELAAADDRANVAAERERDAATAEVARLRSDLEAATLAVEAERDSSRAELERLRGERDAALSDAARPAAEATRVAQPIPARDRFELTPQSARASSVGVVVGAIAVPLMIIAFVMLLRLL